MHNVIANAWIDSKDALFDISTLPELAVSRDLFNDRILIERQAFMTAQANVLDDQRRSLTEEGWK